MTTRYCAQLVLLCTLASMLFPRQFLAGIDLEQRTVEGGAFGLCMVLMLLVRVERLRKLRCLNATTLIGSVTGAALELIAIAGLAEVGQLLVHRHAAFGHFVANAIIIVVVAAIFASGTAYLAVRSQQRLAKWVFGD